MVQLPCLLAERRSGRDGGEAVSKELSSETSTRLVRYLIVGLVARADTIDFGVTHQIFSFGPRVGG